MSSELKKGQIISGLLRQDILEEDIYYLRFNNYFCVKIQYEYLVNKDDVFDVEITSIDHENEEIHQRARDHHRRGARRPRPRLSRHRDRRRPSRHKQGPRERRPRHHRHLRRLRP